MKKILVFLLTAAMLFALTACGSEGTSEETAQETFDSTAGSEAAEISAVDNTLSGDSSEAAGDGEEEKADPAALWNGEWNGTVRISDSTGCWEYLNDTVYDAVMTVELDENGKGTLQIRDPNGTLIECEDGNKFADVKCRADAGCLYGNSGTCFDYAIASADWKFVRDGADPVSVTAASSFTDADGGTLRYEFTFLSPGNVPETRENTATGKKSELLGEDPQKLDINSRGIVYVFYPKNRYEYNREEEKLIDLDGGASIQFNPLLGPNAFENFRTEFGKGTYTSMDDYEIYETTVADLPALVCCGTDPDASRMFVVVDFGREYNGYYGLCFNVTGKTVEECKTKLVWAVINSMELKK